MRSLYPKLKPTIFHKYASRPERMHPVIPWWTYNAWRTTGEFHAVRVDGHTLGGTLKDFVAFDIICPMETPDVLAGDIWWIEGEGPIVVLGFTKGLPVTLVQPPAIMARPPRIHQAPGALRVWSPSGKIWAPPGWLPEDYTTSSVDGSTGRS